MAELFCPDGMVADVQQPSWLLAEWLIKQVIVFRGIIYKR